MSAELLARKTGQFLGPLALPPQCGRTSWKPPQTIWQRQQTTCDRSRSAEAGCSPQTSDGRRFAQPLFIACGGAVHIGGLDLGLGSDKRWVPGCVNAQEEAVSKSKTKIHQTWGIALS